jgi:hypothetical protein
MIKRMEIQSYRFAGFVLIPTYVLQSTINLSVKQFGGIDNLSIEDLSKITNLLREEFFVSGDCLRRQIELVNPSFIKTIEEINNK